MPGVLSADVYTRGDDGTLHQTDGTTDKAVNGWLGGVVSCQVAAGTAHTSTVTEALIGSYSIPANTLVAGSVIEVQYQGIATATTNTDTLTVKLYIGGITGTAVLTGTATDVANNAIFAGKATLVIRTIGTAGTFVAYGHHTDVPAVANTATMAVAEIVASTAINTETAQVVAVGADWSTADVNNSCRLDIFIVKIY
jgi:hypothetical protein